MKYLYYLQCFKKIDKLIDKLLILKISDWNEGRFGRLHFQILNQSMNILYVRVI